MWNTHIYASYTQHVDISINLVYKSHCTISVSLYFCTASLNSVQNHVYYTYRDRIKFNKETEYVQYIYYIIKI